MATPQEALPGASWKEPTRDETLLGLAPAHRWPGPEPDIHFQVFGIPAQKGSKRAFQHKTTQRVVVVDDNNAKLRDWTRAVNDVVQGLADEGCPKLDGAVVLGALFYMPRPASHPKTRRTWPVAKPDLSKLIRALEDPMTGVLIEDDARIVRYAEVAKEYAIYSGDDRPRAEVALWLMSTWEAWRP